MAGLRFLLFLALLGTALSQISLEQYNVDPNTITVSGLSAGGAFATQYHVIYSSEIAGAAIFAGLIYHCANGLLGTALMCMSTPSLTDVNSIIKKTDNLAADGGIDPTIGMSGDKVYIFTGTEDTTVRPANGDKIETFYNNYNSVVHRHGNIAAEHCQPTDFYGPACDYNGGEFINNCNYNGAFEALNYLYDNTLTRPTSPTTLNGIYDEFNQEEFFADAHAVSFAPTGYIYIPSQCVTKIETCRLHVVFHGCKQGSEYLNDVFVTQTGYLETGEVNNIILLFPQIVHRTLDNPNGCWDWWGYTGYYAYVKNTGPQNIGIKSMIDRLVKGTV